MGSVSVIIPTLDRPGLLLQAIESVANQTRAPLEIIVVDDGSSRPVNPGGLQARFGSTVRVLRNDHSEGLAWARNQGVEAARGNYVVNLDDDDLFDPHLLEECAALLDQDLTVEMVFIGVKGFGKHAEYFNHVHPLGTFKVVEEGQALSLNNDLYRFKGSLMRGLLKRVPMSFQRVMARREAWHKVSQLRLRSYRTALRLPSDSDAKNLIRGLLRDSEWALYAAAACPDVMLINRPLYLQRCEGQGRSSREAMREMHLKQSLAMKTIMSDAAHSIGELAPWRKTIRASLAQAHFSAAYQAAHSGQRGLALSHLARSLILRPRLGWAKLLGRILLGPKLLKRNPQGDQKGQQ